MQVHEESLSEVHLVLPASQEDLSDADLEMVAGGAGWDPSAECTDDYGGRRIARQPVQADVDDPLAEAVSAVCRRVPEPLLDGPGGSES